MAWRRPLRTIPAIRCGPPGRRVERMFKRILIANRGEIALRVIRSAREMGLESIAVYSEADARALHTRMADVAVPLGGKLPSKVSRHGQDPRGGAETGAEAIHPATGSSARTPSSRAGSRRPASRGSGRPRASHVGDKITSRRVMKEAGVPCVPDRRSSG